jgi:lipoate-protein ligase A
MNKLRLIISQASDGPGNMSLDEAIFDTKIKDLSMPSTVRIYTWNKPCITIGYFQKYKDFGAFGLTITRRMTGGLLVAHGTDVSYSFVLDENSWAHIYDQEKTYEEIHKTIKAALEKSGIKLSFVSVEVKNPAVASERNVCVQTLFPYDLVSGNKKIVGSCQRRRGKTLLVQGSIHLPKNTDRQTFYENWEKSLGMLPGIRVARGEMNDSEKKLSDDLMKTKYCSIEWNNKF